MRFRAFNTRTGAALLALTSAAVAQAASSSGSSLEEI
jgi:hypothetical protein